MVRARARARVRVRARARERVRVRVGVNPNALGGEAHPQLVAVLVHHGALEAREARGQRDGLRAVLGLSSE